MSIILFRGAHVLLVEASQVTEMLEANVIAPYKFRKVSDKFYPHTMMTLLMWPPYSFMQEKCKIWFSLNYGSTDNVLSLLLTVSGLEKHFTDILISLYVFVASQSS